MHTEDLTPWTHAHSFATGGEAAAERRTAAVTVLTLAMMVAEIVVGSLTNSMALLADGFHMSTHAGALGIAAFAYNYARRHAADQRYAFGTGKVGALAAFASAIILGMVALLMVWESAARLLSVQQIAFDEALWIAALGLGVNLLSAVILGGHHHHDHHHEDDHHGHHHHHHHHHHDHNLRAAYLHVLADALTSVLAISALLFGKYLGWWWMDPMMGIVGALVILKWAYGLIHGSAGILLDRNDDPDLAGEVRAVIEGQGDARVSDLHLWQVGPGHWAAIVALVTTEPRPAQHYRDALARVHELSHVTVEVHGR
jgi:cation diffusion facilitator family transporter